MDRQRLSLALLCSVSFACNEDTSGRHAFDGPTSSTWLEAGEGPFDDAIGFVANSRSGTIVPIDLKHATLMGDQNASPFLPPRWVATGDERQLGELVAWAPDTQSIRLFVADHANQQLVEAPYIVSVDESTGEPQVFEASWTEPVMKNEAGQSIDSAQLNGLEVAQGYTTTEDWRIEYSDSQWWVFGSRSGKQSQPAMTGEAWRADNRELAFTIEGSAQNGDRFELSTDTGIIEHDLGGYVMDVERVTGTDFIVAAIWDSTTETGDVLLWNMREGQAVGQVGLADAGQPWKLTLGPQSDETVTVYAGNARKNAIHIIELNQSNPSISDWTEVETTGPISALAYLEHAGNALIDEAGYQHLFVATINGSRVDVLDLTSMNWLDINPFDGVVGGIQLHSPVIGLSASRVPVPLQEETAWEARKDDRVVAVTTFEGSLMMLEGATGCLAVEQDGPNVPSSSSGEATDFEDHGATSTPTLYQDPSTRNSVVFQSCGGIARSEIWTATYDGTAGNYKVEGSISGEQENRVWEDERYMTDHGEMSFLILSGAAPTTDGDTFSIQVDDGVLRVNQVIRPGGLSSDALEQPAPPLVFDIEAGPTGGGWDEDRTQVHILLPVTNSDFVMRVRADSWETEVIWD